MTTIPDAAVSVASEVIAKALKKSGVLDDLRGTTRAAIEAAMPAIREAVAQDIRASVAVTDHPDGSFSGSIYHAQYTHGIEDAARIVEGAFQ